MDPATAFSVGCGVIQVLDFGIKTARLAWEVSASTSGASAENEIIAEKTKTLQELTKSLSATLNGTQGAGRLTVPTGTSRALTQIALKCDSASLRLISYLEALRVDRSRSYLSQALQTLKVPIKRSKVKRIEEDLESYQSQLEVHLIADIRALYQTSSRDQVDGLRRLGKDHQAILAAIARNETRLGTLASAGVQQTRDLIEHDGNLTRTRIAAVSHAQRTASTDLEREQLVDSFSFPGIFDRQDAIDPAADRTYQWMFQLDSNSRVPWDNFIRWLQTDSVIYWICGKAGSGKTTLMSYIWASRHADRDAHLLNWSGSHRLITAAVFFWNPGSHLQKSTSGLLRSLIYQILRSCPEILSNLSSDVLAPISKAHPWGEEKLKGILLHILKQTWARFCFFIDGLDEFEDASQATDRKVTNLILSLISQSGGRLKCCLSSRPLKSFEDLLDTHPKLMLQDLTRSDIETFAQQELGDRADATLVSEITEKAQGVFLWVRIAVQSLITGMSNEDTPMILRERLRNLPPDLKELFEQMLTRIENVYQREAAMYFSMVLHSRRSDDATTCRFVVATQSDYLRHISEPWTERRISALRQECELMEKRIRICTGGLLETKPVLSPYGCTATRGNRDELASRKSTLTPGTTLPEDQKAILKFLFERRVDFLHRTVQEFLLQHGSNLLQQYPKVNLHLAQLQASAAIFTLGAPSGFVNQLGLKQPDLLSALNHAAEAEDLLKKPCARQLDALSLGLRIKQGNPPPNPKNGHCYAELFLEKAAQSGLHLYLKHVLHSCDSDEPLQGKSALGRLLGFATGTYSSNFERRETAFPSYLNSRRLRLIKLLLVRGADPNEVPPELMFREPMTSWQTFLALVVRQVAGAKWYPKHPTSARREIEEVARELLNHGASLDATFDMWTSRDFQVIWDKGDICLRGTGLFVLQMLAAEPCGKESGARILKLRSYHGKEYELTSHESSHLLEALLAFWRQNDDGDEASDEASDDASEVLDRRYNLVWSSSIRKDTNPSSPLAGVPKLLGGNCPDATQNHDGGNLITLLPRIAGTRVVATSLIVALLATTLRFCYLIVFTSSYP